MLSAHSGDFNLTDGYYLRTVTEDELTVGFDDDADGKSEIWIPCSQNRQLFRNQRPLRLLWQTFSLIIKIFLVVTLSYSLEPAVSGFSDDAVTINFGDEVITFQCQYGRTINVGSEMTVSAPPEQPLVAVGQLSYTMDVQVGSHGGDTFFNINAQHSFDDITPK